MKEAIISIDGASKGNPGPAGIGIVIRDNSGMVLKEISEHIGDATNNMAEYSALIRALTETIGLGFTHASVQSDSELMVKQINGQYKVKNEGLYLLFQSANELIRKFHSFTITHVARERNKRADKLASDAALRSQSTGDENPVFDADAMNSSDMVPSMNGSVKLDIRTSSRCQFVNITSEVQRIVSASGITNGICVIYVPHTTAGITINENADPDVVHDIINTLNRLVPADGSYRHAEGNSDAHVKASMMGSSVMVLVEDGRMLLGTWQGIYFCEFDGPRNRHVLVRVSH